MYYICTIKIKENNELRNSKEKFVLMKLNNLYVTKVLKRKIVFDFGIETAKEYEADNVILRFPYLEKIRIN